MRPNWTVYTRMLLVVAIACLASVARADDKKDGDKKEGEKKPAASATGTWKWTMAGQNGQQRESTLKLKQDGEKPTGHYSGQLGENDITGTIQGNKITFGFSGDFGGQAAKVTYTGTVEKDTMKGTVDLGGMASGTFTGKKQ